jgi:hypothetical protein
MKRIEFVNHRRRSPMQSRNAADTVMMLAQITLERRRLEQERASLEKRLRRIDGRLHSIAGTETRLVPTLRVSNVPQPKNNVALEVHPTRESIRSEFAEMVVQY